MVDGDITGYGEIINSAQVVQFGTGSEVSLDWPWGRLRLLKYPDAVLPKYEALRSGSRMNSVLPYPLNKTMMFKNSAPRIARDKEGLGQTFCKAPTITVLTNYVKMCYFLLSSPRKTAIGLHSFE